MDDLIVFTIVLSVVSLASLVDDRLMSDARRKRQYERLAENARLWQTTPEKLHRASTWCFVALALVMQALCLGRALLQHFDGIE